MRKLFGWCAVNSSVRAVWVGLAGAMLCTGTLAGCEQSVFEPSVYMLYSDDPIDNDFWDRPWPADSRRNDGIGLSVELSPFLHGDVAANSALQEYIATIETLLATPGGGFSTNGAIFLPFSQPITSANWSDSVVLVNAQSDSSQCGTTVPVDVAWFDGATRFRPANTLAVMPVAGNVLAPNSRYILAVSDDVTDEFGRQLAATGAWINAANQAIEKCDSGRDYFKGARPVAGTIFTTGDPGYFVQRAQSAIEQVDIAVSAATIATDYDDVGTTCVELEGTIDLPQFQVGDKPFLRTGGEVEWDDETPTIQRNETATYSLVVPRDAEGKTPLVLYAHGTGGSRRSGIRNGSAKALCEMGYAVVGLSQPLHAERKAKTSDDASLYSFNFLNLASLVYTFQQGAVELFALENSFDQRTVSSAIWSHPTTNAIILQPSGFFGHSQGALTGAMYLPYSRRIESAVVSGSSGHFTFVVLDKKAPLDFAVALENILGAQSDFDQWQPLLSLFQTVAEPADPINYGRYLAVAPPNDFDDWQPKHILLTEGIVDMYTPPRTMEAYGRSVGAELVGPVIRDVAEVNVVARTTSENVNGRTVVWPQYDSGHFSLWDTAQGRSDWRDFMRSALVSNSAPQLQEAN